MFTMTEVTSSQIKEIGYNEETNAARVIFKRKDGSTSATWDYSPVTAEEFDRWLNAESVGKYFNALIKGVVPGTKVSG